MQESHWVGSVPNPILYIKVFFDRQNKGFECKTYTNFAIDNVTFVFEDHNFDDKNIDFAKWKCNFDSNLYL